MVLLLYGFWSSSTLVPPSGTGLGLVGFGIVGGTSCVWSYPPGGPDTRCRSMRPTRFLRASRPGGTSWGRPRTLVLHRVRGVVLVW